MQKTAIENVMANKKLLQQQLNKLTTLIGLIEKEGTLKPNSTMGNKSHRDKYKAKNEFAEKVLQPAKLAYYSDDPNNMPDRYQKAQQHIEEKVTSKNYEAINQKIQTELEVINHEITKLQTGLLKIADESRKVQKFGTSKTEEAVQHIRDEFDGKGKEAKKPSNPWKLFTEKAEKLLPKKIFKRNSQENTSETPPDSPKPGKRNS